MIACRFEPPPEARTAMRALIARSLLRLASSRKRTKESIDRLAKRSGRCRRFGMRTLAVLRWRGVDVEQNTLAAESRRRRHVAHAVTDEECRRAVELVLGDGLPVERKPGLATIARSTDVRVMRTHVDAIDVRTFRREECGETTLHGVVVFASEPAARDA